MLRQIQWTQCPYILNNPLSGNYVRSNVACARSMRYIKESAFWLAQMTLYVMRLCNFVRPSKITLASSSKVTTNVLPAFVVDSSGCNILSDLVVHDIDMVVWLTRAQRPESIFINGHVHDEQLKVWKDKSTSVSSLLFNDHGFARHLWLNIF